MASAVDGLLVPFLVGSCAGLFRVTVPSATAKHAQAVRKRGDIDCTAPMHSEQSHRSIIADGSSDCFPHRANSNLIKVKPIM